MEKKYARRPEGLTQSEQIYRNKICSNHSPTIHELSNVDPRQALDVLDSREIGSSIGSIQEPNSLSSRWPGLMRSAVGTLVDMQNTKHEVQPEFCAITPSGTGIDVV